MVLVRVATLPYMKFFQTILSCSAESLFRPSGRPTSSANLVLPRFLMYCGIQCCSEPCVSFFSIHSYRDAVPSSSTFIMTLLLHLFWCLLVSTLVLQLWHRESAPLTQHLSISPVPQCPLSCFLYHSLYSFAFLFRASRTASHATRLNVSAFMMPLSM